MFMPVNSIQHPLVEFQRPFNAYMQENTNCHYAPQRRTTGICG